MFPPANRDRRPSTTFWRAMIRLLAKILLEALLPEILQSATITKESVHLWARPYSFLAHSVTTKLQRRNPVDGTRQSATQVMSALTILCQALVSHLQGTPASTETSQKKLRKLVASVSCNNMRLTNQPGTSRCSYQSKQGTPLKVKSMRINKSVTRPSQRRLTRSFWRAIRPKSC